jgi:multidrug resistance efflux pump
LRPWRRCRPVICQISGTVQKWSVDIGAKVKQGDLLAQIDLRSYQAALDQIMSG